MSSVPTVSNIEFDQVGSVHNTRRMGLFDVTCKFFDEKLHTVFKAGYVLPRFGIDSGFLPNDHEGLNRWCFHSQMVKLARGPFDFCKYSHRAMSYLGSWLNGETITFKKKFKVDEKRKVELLDVFRETNNCVNYVYDTADFLTKAILYVPKQSLRTLAGINGVSLIIAQGWNVFDSLNWISKCEASKKTGAEQNKVLGHMLGYLLAVARDVSLVVIGCFVVLTIYFQYVFSPFLWSVFSASNVVFTILDFYYEHTGTTKEIK